MTIRVIIPCRASSFFSRRFRYLYQGRCIIVVMCVFMFVELIILFIKPDILAKIGFDVPYHVDIISREAADTECWFFPCRTYRWWCTWEDLLSVDIFHMSYFLIPTRNHFWLRSTCIFFCTTGWSFEVPKRRIIWSYF